MRRHAGFLVLLAALTTLGAPDATRGEAPEPRIVLGTGNRLSGEIPILLLGDASRPECRALIAFAKQVEERSGLRVPVHVGSGTDVAAIVVTGEPTDAELQTMKRFRDAGVGVVLDLRAHPDQARAPLYLDLLRSIVECRSAVRHVRSAFENVSAMEVGGDVDIDVETTLPGKVTMSMITVDGKVIVPEGDLRPMPYADIEGDIENTLVRLRFIGESGLTGEARYWLPSLLPGRLPNIRILGSSELSPGDRGLYRVIVENERGRPLQGCRIRARLLDCASGGITDAAGSCVLRLAPLPEGTDERLLLEVEAIGRYFHRTHSIPIRVSPPPRTLTLETDRGVYRPGGTVRFRGLIVNARSHVGIEGEVAKVSVTDPRKRRIAVFEERTDRFGAVTMELPLAEGITEGNYEVRMTAAGAKAEQSFEVDEFALPEIDVAIRLDRQRFEPDEDVTGTIEVRTFDGEPLPGAAISVSLDGPENTESVEFESAEATTKFRIPAAKVGIGLATLDVTAYHSDEDAYRELEVRIGAPPPPHIVISTIPIKPLGGHPFEILVEVRDERERPVPATLTVRLDEGEARMFEATGGVARLQAPARPSLTSTGVTVSARTKDLTIEKDASILVGTGLRIMAPATARPGVDLPVTVLVCPSLGQVHVDLVAGGRLLAAASGLPNGGVLRLNLPVPADLVGAARLFARGPDYALVTRDLHIHHAGLEVNLEPAELDARPGDDAEVAVQVRDASGAEVEALLDIRSVDAAYLAATGPIRTTAARFPRHWPASTPPVLVDDRAGEAWVHLDDRIQTAARPVLERARLLIESGKPVDIRMPWGAPILAHRTGRAVILSVESAVTYVPRPHALLAPVLAVWGADEKPEFPAQEALPRRLERPYFGGKPWIDGFVDQSFDWLSRHQSPDGSFDPTGYTEHCKKPGCVGVADPALRPGTTALALLTWFGAGETHRTGTYRAHVKAAIRHLHARQGADGFIGDPGGPWALLNHAMATLALCEGYALTGSPLLLAPAQRALNALSARQRDDGSFAETGWSEGSLVLTTWATMAFKSGKEAGKLRIDPEIFQGIARWVDARTDAGTGAVRPSTEDVGIYPFPGTGHPEVAAGMTIVMRIFLGEDPRQSEPIQQAAQTMLGRLPEYFEGECDFHGWWMGSIALFQVGGEPWKAWNVAMKTAIIDHQRRDGCGRGSWDPGPCTVGRIGRTCFASMCLVFYYRYGRVFGTRDGGAGGARTNFPDLALVDLARPTDEHGRATIGMKLADSVTTWKLLVGAWDGRGRYARAEASIRARLPLHASFTLPPRLIAGDVLRLPVRVRSTLEKDIEAVVTIAEVEGFEAASAKPVTVTVPAGGMAAAVFELTALAEGPARLRVSVEAEGHRDAVERRCEIEDAGVPVMISTLVAPGETVSVAHRIPASVGDLTAKLTITSSPLADAASGLEGLLRRPTGCFEQTSATLYPALLAFGVLKDAGRLDAPMAVLARRHLLTGYQRILAFECRSGGFSLFVDGTARADLTALGIHELLDLEGILSIDRDVIDRAATFLSGRKIDEPASHLYVLAALKRAGRTVDASAIVRKALDARDPYLVALAAVHGLLPEAEKARAGEILESTAVAGGRGLIWRSAALGLFTDLQVTTVETTSLATLALAGLDGRRDLVLGGSATVRAARWGDGAWPTTRQTVAALRTLLLVAREHTTTRGRITVSRTSRPSTTHEIGGSGKPVTLDLGAWSRTDELRVDFSGEGRPWTTLIVEGRAADQIGTRGPLALSVAWPAGPLPRGTKTTIRVRVANTTTEVVSSPTAEIRFPAGLDVDRRALEDAASAARFQCAEIRAGRIVLYLTRLGAGQAVMLDIPAKARRTGRFRPGAARVYPYYEPDRETVLGDSVVTVTEEE
jgi:MG2 domain/A-macroglobulin TED domain/Alpha-2-macroglobulin family/A-macroglobulin receptor binding domain